MLHSFISSFQWVKQRLKDLSAYLTVTSLDLDKPVIVVNYGGLASLIYNGVGLKIKVDEDDIWRDIQRVCFTLGIGWSSGNSSYTYPLQGEWKYMFIDGTIQYTNDEQEFLDKDLVECTVVGKDKPEPPILDTKSKTWLYSQQLQLAAGDVTSVIKENALQPST